MNLQFKDQTSVSENDLNLTSDLPDLLLDWLTSSPLQENIDTTASLFKIQTFQLGQSIFAAAGLKQDSSSKQTSHNSDLFLICQGQVRLLCQGPDQSRPVSACLLKPGDLFGADAALIPGIQPLPYWAVAASDCQIAQLSGQTLADWLKRYPDLRDSLQQRVQKYQQLIFLRTLTSLRSLPSRAIRQLTDRLQEITIPSGTPLQQFLAPYPGQYWLRQGVISTSLTASPSPRIGEHWGQDLTLATEGWTAQTDLQIYYLAADHSEVIADLVDNSKPSSTQPSAGPAPSQLDGRYAKVGAIPPDIVHSPGGASDPIVQTQVTQSPQTNASPSVLFPKPVQRQVLDALHRFPWVEQQSSSDCGAACLAMIARYWGQRLPIHILRERANVGRSGASLKGLARAAESIGFHARPVRASLGRIAEQSNPWIAHWQGDHYVVVYRVDQKQVTLADPALGRRTLTREEFQTHWTGYALLLDPTERLKDVEVKQASLGRYIALLFPYRALITQIILVSLLIQAFSLVTPLFTQIILDKVVVQKSMSTLNVFAIGLLMFSVWGIAMGTVRNYLLSYFSMRLDLTLVSGFIKHAISLPLKFYESRRVGDILTRVQENQKIQRFLIGQVMLAWLGFLTGFVYLGLMLYYNLQLTLMVLALIPPIILITLGSTPFLQKISREVFKEAAEQNSTLVEMMNGIAAVKSAGAEQEVRWRWEESLTRLNNVSFKGQKFGIGLGALNGTVNALGSTALLWIGAMMVIQDQLTIGQFVAFNMMIGYVLSPVIALANLWDELQEIFISIERLNDVFEAEPEEPLNQTLLVLPPIQGEVIFDDVSFRYGSDEERNTLQNISFEVKTGQTIAIVGRSGSGKTTLIKLLEGLYHPNKGRVLVDGHDIRHVSPHSLRTQLGVVPQECFLFSGTILENITLYRHEFTLEQAVEAAKLAEAHAFIQALPLGYNTKVGERGANLSGGQRQRIAIARALLGDPRILILDEATSSLDTESERRFQQNLAQISRDRTTFIIAHRLSTVRNASSILVLDKGVLVEQGTHTELMSLKGLYYTLAEQQLNL